MLVAITGTPGTGKTTLSAEMRRRGYEVVDGKAFMKERGILGDYDAERDTYEVDPDDLDEAMDAFRGEGALILDSHLAHLIGFDKCIVLRCHPGVLAERLRARGYGEEKVVENVQAEILDVILCEAIESGGDVYEIDCTSRSVEEAADMVADIINGNGDDRLPGRVDWSGEMEEWFWTPNAVRSISR